MNGKSRFSFSKIFYNDKFVMLFSVVVAFCIWVTLPGNSDDTSYAYIKDIPITVPDLGTDTKMYYKSQDTASVRVSGNSLILRNLSKDDIEVSPDESVNEYEIAKEKTVKLTAKKGSIVNDYTIITGSLDPEEVTVFIDREDEIDLPIESKLNAKIADGYHNDGITLQKKTVHLKGAQSVIQSIASAVAICDYDKELTSTVSIDAPIKYYDYDGNEIDSKYFERKYIEPDITSVNAKITILKLDTILVTPNIINAPSSFNPGNDLISLSPATVEIAFPEDGTDYSNSVTTKELDLSKVDPNNSEFDLDLVVSSGVRLISDGVSSVKVKFDSDKMDSKNFTVNNIITSNVPSGKKWVMNTKSINITLVGNKEQLNKLTANDLTAVIDMGNTESLTGSMTFYADIKISSVYDSCWPYWMTAENPYRVLVTVSDKDENDEKSDTSESAASETS